MSMSYRADIDGLRALAVLAVVFYHAEIAVFGARFASGGFLGVDIFFVISGYLIANLILSDLVSKNFSLTEFFRRRFFRIAPALLVMMLLSIPVSYFVLLPGDLKNFMNSAVFAGAFLSNFYFIFSLVQYDSPLSLMLPLLHTWSLSVEAQFYLLAPLFVLFGFQTNFKKFSIVVTLILASLVCALVFGSKNAEISFFLPFSRLWEFLLGSLLVFWTKKKIRLIMSNMTANLLQLLGGMLLLFFLFFDEANSAVIGPRNFFVAVTTALLILETKQRGLVTSLLSTKPMVYVGRLSYSIYLYHFVIFAFFRLVTVNPATVDKFGLLLLTFILSHISYRFIETPFRINGSRSQQSPLLCAVIGGLLISLSFLSLKTDGFSSRMPALWKNSIISQKPWDVFKQDGSPCFERKEAFCRIQDSPNQLTVYNFGDSHAASIAPELIKVITPNFGYVEANASCPFVLNVSRFNRGKLSDCQFSFQQKRYDLLPKNKSAIIIISGRFPQYLEGHGFDNKEGGVEGKKYIEFRSQRDLAFSQEIVLTLNKLLDDGHHIVLVYPIPEVGFNVPKTLLKVAENSSVQGLSGALKEISLTTSSAVYMERASQTFKIFDSVKHPNIHRVYPHQLFCDTDRPGRCVTHNQTEIFYADDDHPSASGAKLIADRIFKKIQVASKAIKIVEIK